MGVLGADCELPDGQWQPAISVELHGDYAFDINNILDDTGYNDWDAELWNCYTDSDLAGNTEIQNKRRSQNGDIATPPN